MIITHQQLIQIAQTIFPDSTLTGSKQLVGGISTQTLLLTVTRPDNQIGHVVLRQHGLADRQRNPNIARDEFRLLEILHRMGLPVPEPIYFDMSNTILDIPYLILEYIEHDNLLSKDINKAHIQQLSYTLARIHQTSLSNANLSFLPDQKVYLASTLSQPPTDDPKKIYHHLNHALPFIYHNPIALLHGDYWLGNVLWRKDKLIAVIDWEDMMVGDPLSDLGKSRLELLWATNEDTMIAYTNNYQKQQENLDFRYLPFWDLWGAFRLRHFEKWFEESAELAGMRIKFDQFIDHAIAKLKVI